MKNKGGIIALLLALVLISGYFLARTWKANGIRKEAEVAATDKNGKVNFSKKQSYVDSLWKQPVFLGSTMEDLSKQELGLGLDLQGGMHVILEVSPVEIVRSLASSSRDPKVSLALKNAQEISKTNNTNFVDIFAAEFKKVAPSTSLASVFATSGNRSVINLNSSDSQVAKYIKTEMDVAFTKCVSCNSNAC